MSSRCYVAEREGQCALHQRNLLSCVEEWRGHAERFEEALLSFIKAPPAIMSVGDGRFLPVSSHGMRTLIDELNELRRKS